MLLSNAKILFKGVDINTPYKTKTGTKELIQFAVVYPKNKFMSETTKEVFEHYCKLNNVNVTDNTIFINIYTKYPLQFFNAKGGGKFQDVLKNKAIVNCYINDNGQYVACSQNIFVVTNGVSPLE